MESLNDDEGTSGAAAAYHELLEQNESKLRIIRFILKQAINSPSIPTAVGKCKISIEKNKKK